MSARPRKRTAGPRPARRGMTLVEVLLAFTIFGSVLVGMARFAASFVRAVGVSDRGGRAAELAAERLETVKAGTDYDRLDVTFAEPAAVAVPGAPGYTRRTLFSRLGGGAADTLDCRVVTVIVSGPGLAAPVRRTTVIGDF